MILIINQSERCFHTITNQKTHAEWESEIDHQFSAASFWANQQQQQNNNYNIEIATESITLLNTFLDHFYHPLKNTS